MISDPLFYYLAVPAVLIAAISKGGFGAGLGFVSVPLMTLVVSPLQAAAIMLPLLCCMDIFGLLAYRRHVDRSLLPLLLLGAVAGIGIGWALAAWVDDQAVRAIVGTVAVAFTLNHWFGRAGREPARPSAPKGVFWSAVSGFTSFVSHSGGPPLAVYLLPLRLDKTVFQATTVVFFAVVNYVKLVPYWSLGQFRGENLAASLVLAPLAPLGIWAGVWLHQRVSPLLFYRIAYGFIFVIGLKLLWDGLGIGKLLGFA